MKAIIMCAGVLICTAPAFAETAAEQLFKGAGVEYAVSDETPVVKSVADTAKSISAEQGNQAEPALNYDLSGFMAGEKIWEIKARLVPAGFPQIMLDLLLPKSFMEAAPDRKVLLHFRNKTYETGMVQGKNIVIKTQTLKQLLLYFIYTGEGERLQSYLENPESGRQDVE